MMDNLPFPKNVSSFDKREREREREREKRINIIF